MPPLFPAADAPAPRWMPALQATLLVLVCFLVTLLSLSRPDYRRFTQVAEGLGAGFGHEASLADDPLTMGNAVVARSFVPEGEPVPVDAMWSGSGQLPPLSLPAVAAPAVPAAPAAPASPAGPSPEVLATAKAGVESLVVRTRAEAGTLAARFGAGISRGEIEIETRGRTTVLRLLDAGSFADGSTRLERGLRAQIEELGVLLAAQPGLLLVLRAGHAGAGKGEASDWTLSAGRAAAVAEALQSRSPALAERLTVVAYGAGRPLPDVRSRPARSNRVELAITQPLAPELRDTLAALRAAGAAAAFDHALDPQPTEVP